MGSRCYTPFSSRPTRIQQSCAAHLKACCGHCACAELALCSRPATARRERGVVFGSKSVWPLILIALLSAIPGLAQRRSSADNRLEIAVKDENGMAVPAARITLNAPDIPLLIV